ncbi:ATP-binding protein [Verrucomicrobiales bacterium]|nr:ATP-binding protein [Verrucomicrobiales bacterium]
MADYEIANPSAEALIESLRAVGYSLPTAIADIIDNSVAAGAKNVWMDFNWSGAESHITIVDDGLGMSEEVLSNAMRPGSQSPLDDRQPSDLGRFGLGMKTASFSQCRILSVISKVSDGAVSKRCWNLDFVSEHNEWRLLKEVTKKAEAVAQVLDELENGTVVMWERLDRVTGDSSVSDEKAHRHFLGHIDDTRKHLAMIFHRFLAAPKPRLKIFVNGRKEADRIEAWDPFLEDHPCTNPTPIDPVQFGGSIVSIRGYVLPHKDKLSGDGEYESGGGPGGWNSQQGFYIYRGDRMLVSGSWLKLGPVRPWAKEEHYKLARLSIDIPNSMDSDWSIDVKKSMAMPPRNIRHKLLKLAESVRDDARKVFAHRGEYGPRGSSSRAELERPWEGSTRNGHTIYRIRRNHVIIRNLIKQMGTLKPELETLLRFIEETVPVQKIWLDAAENEKGHAIAYDGIDEEVILGDMKKAWEMLLESGCSPEEAELQIGTMEPFHRYPAMIDQLNGR